MLIVLHYVAAHIWALRQGKNLRFGNDVRYGTLTGFTARARRMRGEASRDLSLFHSQARSFPLASLARSGAGGDHGSGDKFGASGRQRVSELVA